MNLLVTCVLFGIIAGFAARFVGTWRQNERLMESCPLVALASFGMSMAVAVVLSEQIFHFHDIFPLWFCVATPFVTIIAAGACAGAAWLAYTSILVSGRGIDFLGERARVRWDAYRGLNQAENEPAE
jgi:hypothetical protein